jgi:predicted DCC family thiol-disulfide oxidoreductase YuxK
MAMTDNAVPSCATVYYDGACPICQREIAIYKRKADRQGVAFVDAAACDVSLLGNGLTREAALGRMHVRRADGNLVSGAAAFAELWQAVPGFRLIGRIVSFAPVTWVLELAYRASLKIRPYLQPLFR